MAPDSMKNLGFQDLDKAQTGSATQTNAKSDGSKG